MKFFSWFTSIKVAKGTENAEDVQATPPTLALPTSQDVSEVARRFSETAQLFSDTLREKGDLLRNAQERLDQHKESQKALEQALVEVTTSKAQAELDLEKMEDDRKQIMSQMKAIDMRMKRKREHIDELELDLKRARDNFENGEKETPRLQQRKDAEQHDHELLISTSFPTSIPTSIPTSTIPPTMRKLDYPEDDPLDHGDNRLALVAVEPVKKENRLAAVNAGKAEARKYRKGAKVAKVEAEDFPRVTVIESFQDQPTGVKVISADGSEETYRTGEFVHVLWQGHRAIVDGVSYTKFLNAAWFGQIETIGKTREGRWKFGLKCFYFSHFTIDGEKFKIPSQNFLSISDEDWMRNNVHENDIFRSREKMEYLEIGAINGKLDKSHEDVQKNMRFQYDYVKLSPSEKKRCGMLYTIAGFEASRASESPPESPPKSTPESLPESPRASPPDLAAMRKVILGLDDIFEKDTPIVGILRPKNK